MSSHTYTPQAQFTDLVVRELSDEVLLYDLRKHKGHCLNKTAAFVYDHSNGQSTVREIAELMATEWNTTVNEEIVWLALKELERANLLQHDEALTTVRRRQTRRQALRQIGLASAMALPFVVSVVAPSAAAAATIPPICTSCMKKTADGCLGACATVPGTCYDNDGCGAGQALGCTTCSACFSAGTTRSWKASGAIC